VKSKFNSENRPAMFRIRIHIDWALLDPDLGAIGVGDPETFWCGSGSPDPYLWLMDPTPFFIDFKDAKKNFIFFSYNLPTTFISSSG
jgi:hypothetical protein